MAKDWVVEGRWSREARLRNVTVGSLHEDREAERGGRETRLPKKRR